MVIKSYVHAACNVNPFEAQYQTFFKYLSWQNEAECMVEVAAMNNARLGAINS